MKLTFIPYRIQAHPETGLTNGLLATWLFLASEIMLFGALFSAYAMLRVGAPDRWPQGSQYLSLKWGGINTLLLLLSTGTAWYSRKSLRSGFWKAYSLSISATIFLAGAFVYIKTVEYQRELAHGLLPATHNFLGLYFALTGFHGLHVVGGMVAFAFLLFFARSMEKELPGLALRRLECTLIYWQFVDVVWLILYSLFYLW